MFLTPEEIQLLTGKKFRTAQATALCFMGIEHKVRPDGSIAVLKSHVEQVMGGVAPVKHKRKFEPDWDALNA